MYNRAFPIGNALFLFVGGVMSLFRLPRGKLAFAQRSGAMKAPVGLLSDRTVLRKQDGGASPRQVTAGLPRCSSRQGWPGRMPVQTVDDFIGVRGSVCGLFLFVQTHAPLDICEQHTMCLLLCCLVFNICECGFQRSKIVLMLVNDLQNHITLRIIGHLLQLVVE